MNNDFDVYTYTANDGTVFFVGKALNGRANDVANHNPDVVSYASRNGCEITKVKSGLTKDQAFAEERDLIKTYGFAQHGGTLLNRVNGQGDGKWAEDWTKWNPGSGNGAIPDDYLALAGGLCRPGSSVLLPCCGISGIGKYLPDLKRIAVNDIEPNNVRLTIGKVLKDMAGAGKNVANGSFITGDFLTVPVDGKFDFIFLPPPFQNPATPLTNSGYVFKMIDRARSLLVPGGAMVFIAPYRWRGHAARQQTGLYQLLVENGEFPGAPPADIVLYVNNNAPLVVDVSVMSETIDQIVATGPRFRATAISYHSGQVVQVPGFHHMTGKRREPGAVVAKTSPWAGCCVVSFTGDDAAVALDWFIDNFARLKRALGKGSAHSSIGKTTILRFLHD